MGSWAQTSALQITHTITPRGDRTSSSSSSSPSSAWRILPLSASKSRGGASRDNLGQSLWSAGRFNAPVKKQLCSLLSAKRKSSGADSTADEDELDDDLRAGLNEVTTEALRVMLAENDKMVEQFREKVDYLGEYLVQEGHLDAARFMLVVRGMLDHEVYPQKDDLKGAYKKAFDKIAHLIEDSGWVLKQEGQDVGGVEMVDAELIPPVLKSQY